MRNQTDFERIAKRFLDEVESKLKYAESCFGKSEIAVPIHPEIYKGAMEALEVINELGRSKRIRVEPMVDVTNCQYELKFIRIEEK